MLKFLKSLASTNFATRAPDGRRSVTHQPNPWNVASSGTRPTMARRTEGKSKVPHGGGPLKKWRLGSESNVCPIVLIVLGFHIFHEKVVPNPVPTCSIRPTPTHKGGPPDSGENQAALNGPPCFGPCSGGDPAAASHLRIIVSPAVCIGAMVLHPHAPFSDPTRPNQGYNSPPVRPSERHWIVKASGLIL